MRLKILNTTLWTTSVLLMPLIVFFLGTDIATQHYWDAALQAFVLVIFAIYWLIRRAVAADIGRIID